MKISLNKSGPEKKKDTLLSFIEGGLVQVHHHQTVRYSMNYNSAEASYGVTFSTKVGSIKKATKYAEELVEKHLAAKFKEQRETLKGIASS